MASAAIAAGNLVAEEHTMPRVLCLESPGPDPSRIRARLYSCELDPCCQGVPSIYGRGQERSSADKSPCLEIPDSVITDTIQVANMQTHQTHARKAWESIWEVRKLDKNIDEKVREVRRLEEKLAQKTGEVKRFEEKLDEKKIAVEKLKNEIGQRKNKLRGLLNSVAM
ncbi:uncharacterized protein FFE2_15760 [Fusarium fujikuroi]|nr:uncharacterized protein FFE2_15760 [Fusarium fujikuroi]SCO26723.1 uncharacterized protein FFM5_14992 [Fusarium fujikuroi]